MGGEGMVNECYLVLWRRIICSWVDGGEIWWWWRRWWEYQFFDVNIANGSGRVVQVMGNPFAGACTIRVAAPVAGPFSLRLTDISGKVLWQENTVLGVGMNTFALGQTSGLAKGMYLLTVVGAQVRETVKLVKE